MAEAKTKPTDASVPDYIDSLKSETQRDDCRVIVDLMKSITKQNAVMWGSAIIGFGTYSLTYASGKTADWPLLAFSPRKEKTTIYLMGDFENKKALLKKLGKHKLSGSCLHLNTLNDLHQPTLKSLLKASYTYMKKYEAALKKKK